MTVGHPALLAQLTVLAAIGAATAVAPGCARNVPPDRPAAALYRDLQRLVAVADAAGWQIDRYELEDLMPDVLMSVCQVTPRARAELVAWLDARIAERGGPVEAAYRRAGKRKAKVRDLLELSRIRMAVIAAIEQAGADCPFWLEPDEAFAGRQISDDRWQLSIGGGGKGMLVSRDGGRDLQFGGAGRALVGRNIGSRLGVMLGVEMGASASFPRDEVGGRSGLVLAVDVVAPVVVRYWMVNTYLELEAGYLARVTEQDLGVIDPGVHVGVAFGGRATRVRWFFPGAVFGVSYEQTFPDATRSADRLHMLKIGLRVALDLDL